MRPIQFQKYSLGKFRRSRSCRAQTYVPPPSLIVANKTEGDHIKVTASKYPFPTVCADKASPDWFNAISRTLRWNEREKQKSFVVVEEDNEPAVKKQSDRKQAESNMKSPPSPEKSHPEQVEPEQEDVGDESDDDEEEEDYDIDE
jgi:NAD+ kinase